MNYAEFVRVKQTLGIDEHTAGGLMSCGPCGDNQTSYMLNSKVGIDIVNSYAGIFLTGAHSDKDFVWIRHGFIRTFGPFESGGHPALTRGDMPMCAGRIEADFFFYHSGHFKPQKLEAICHFVDFVETSVAGLTGVPRDNEVARLCSMTLRLYRGPKSKELYDARFEEPSFHGSLRATGKEGVAVKGGISHREARRASLEIDSFSSFDEDGGGDDLPFAMDGFRSTGLLASSPVTNTSPLSSHSGFSSPPPLARPSHFSSSPKFTVSPLTTSSPPPMISSTSTTTTPTTTTRLPSSIPVQPLVNPVPEQRASPVWEPDSASNYCRICAKKFSFIERKHHCRKCGRLVCKACSTTQKVVRNPARSSAKDAERTSTVEPVRVCDTCAPLL